MFRLLLAVCFVSGSLAALTNTDRAAIQDAHNNYRSSLANGDAVNQDGSTLPQGANIAYMTYDLGIESIAQNWANGCAFQHSSSQQRNGTGENLYMTSAQVDAATALQGAADLWWAELAQYGVDPGLNFTMDQFNRGIGHWSQMAWANTATLGCGVQYCDGLGTLVVCNYSPAGNFLNQYIFEAGEPCSDCGDTSTCDAQLCIANLSR